MEVDPDRRDPNGGASGSHTGPDPRPSGPRR